jgi:hypothetical protein
MNVHYRSPGIAHEKDRKSNAEAESPCSASGKGLQPIFDMPLILKRIFPVKTACKFAETAQISERMARYHLARRYEISTPTLATLLRSEHGLTILEEIMGDAQPKWWRGFRRQKSLSVLRAQQAANEKLLRALEEQAAD